MKSTKTLKFKFERTIPAPPGKVFAGWWLNPEILGTPRHEADIVPNSPVRGLTERIPQIPAITVTLQHMPEEDDGQFYHLVLHLGALQSGCWHRSSSKVESRHGPSRCE